jgi:methionyl-tRNA formyltransferase
MSAAKIIFAGTPDFARASLSALVDAGLSRC